MRIGPSPPPSLPIHIARAYGVSRGGAVGASTPSPRNEPSAGVSRLVAGHVGRAISFDGAASELAGLGGRTDALPLYTRAADRVEAAVGVQLGRSLDIRG